MIRGMRFVHDYMSVSLGLLGENKKSAKKIVPARIIIVVPAARTIIIVPAKIIIADCAGEDNNYCAGEDNNRYVSSFHTYLRLLMYVQQKREESSYTL